MQVRVVATHRKHTGNSTPLGSQFWLLGDWYVVSTDLTDQGKKTCGTKRTQQVGRKKESWMMKSTLNQRMQQNKE